MMEVEGMIASATALRLPRLRHDFLLLDVGDCALLQDKDLQTSMVKESVSMQHSDVANLPRFRFESHARHSR